MARKPRTAKVATQDDPNAPGVFEKPRIRVPARAATVDSFTNFAAKLGLGPANMFSAGGYSYDFLTRNRQQLEAGYRTSWLIRAAVDIPADDMTRGGIVINSTMPPDEIEALQAGLMDLMIWQRLAEAKRWGGLYGGAVAIMLIDGQNMATPLRMDSIAPGQFKGLLVLDRWMVQPSMGRVGLVTDFGPDLGLPKFYSVVSDAGALQTMKIHHSRVLRFEGIPLPFYQRQAEMLWGESVIESIHDRLLSFDGTSQSIAQLVYTAHLRTLKIEKLRELIAAGGKIYEAMVAQIQLIRQFQANEHITLLDSTDDFQVDQTTFSGLDSILGKFSEQIAGALEIPLARLFGQSPGGLGSSGESELRTYYDGVMKRQERDMRRPLTVLLDVMNRSINGAQPPKGFGFSFINLWQPSPKERAEIGKLNTEAITGAYDTGLVSQQTAMRELKTTGATSGLWTNIQDEDIEAADEELPTPGEMDQAELELAQANAKNAANPEPEKTPEPAAV